MILDKCTRCYQEFVETTTSYHRRTKDIFNPKPIICYECLRIIKIFNPSNEEFKKTKELYKQEQTVSKRLNIHKGKIKRIVKKYTENPKILKQIKKNNLHRKNQYRLNSAQTRVRRKKSIIEISKDEKKMIREFYEKCPYGNHVDHIIPISKGGKHCLNNLQYLPAKENMKKGNRLKIEILEQFLDYGSLSIPFLQRKFKMNFQDAKNILKEIGIC